LDPEEPKPRRSSPIDGELRALIRRMASENRTWGAPRIHGELLKLGFEVGEATVSRYDLATGKVLRKDTVSAAY
jgi:hypothetical protein